MESKSWSFKGWELVQFLKGRRKMFVTLVSVGVAYFVSDSTTTAIVAGALVEMAFALIEYFMKEYQ